MEVHGIVRATLGSGACFYSPKYRKGCVSPIGSLVNWTDSVWKSEWSLVMSTALPHGNCNPENNHWAAVACWWRLLSLEFRAQWVKYPSWGQWRLCHPSGFYTTWACCALHLDFLPAGTCPLHFTLSPHVRPAELFLPALWRKAFHLHLHPSLSPCFWPRQPQQHSPLWNTGSCLGQSLDRTCFNLLSLCLDCIQQGQVFTTAFIFGHVC